MSFLHRNTPPVYDHSRSHDENFDKFFDWTCSLKHPFKQVPQIGENLGFGIRRHPIGFIAVYLSERDNGIHNSCLSGIARVNIYPPGVEMKEDIHCHGFDFKSGVANGVLINTSHQPDWGAHATDGEGYIGYETTVDQEGRNHTVQATDATIVIASSKVQELEAGDTYSLRPLVDFHSVYAGEDGAVTVFSKTPTYEGRDGTTLVLRKPDQPPIPDIY